MVIRLSIILAVLLGGALIVRATEPPQDELSAAMGSLAGTYSARSDSSGHVRETMLKITESGSVTRAVAESYDRLLLEYATIIIPAIRSDTVFIEADPSVSASGDTGATWVHNAKAWMTGEQILSVGIGTEIYARELTTSAVAAPNGAVLEAAQKSKLLPGTPCCVFLEDALESAGFDISPALSRLINIDLASLDRMNGTSLAQLPLRRLVEEGHPVTEGVVAALSFTHQGQAIPLSEAGPGDIIQYWYEKKNGSLGGHTAIVSHVHPDGRVDLFGSHRYYDKKRAYVGNLTGVDLRKMMAVYVVRPASAR